MASVKENRLGNLIEIWSRIHETNTFTGITEFIGESLFENSVLVVEKFQPLLIRIIQTCIFHWWTFCLRSSNGWRTNAIFIFFDKQYDVITSTLCRINSIGASSIEDLIISISSPQGSEMRRQAFFTNFKNLIKQEPFLISPVWVPQWKKLEKLRYFKWFLNIPL